MVCAGGPVLLRSWMQQVVSLKRQHGIEVIWVTSGAIASAVERSAFSKSRAAWALAEKQALSAIGQPMLMDLYNLAMQATGLHGAQVLLTYTDLADKKRRENFQRTLEQLLKWGVIPVLNENDAVATEEIKFGDNDTLSAKVAGVMAADRLIILTDVDGLFDKDPRLHKKARLIRQLPSVTPAMLAAVNKKEKRKPAGRGTGGMFSKLKAAKEASRHGIETVLVKGDLPSVLLQIAENRFTGTLIEAQASWKITANASKKARR